MKQANKRGAEPAASSNKPGAAEQRLTELEIKVAYHEDTIEKLSQVLIQQQEAVAQLQRGLAELHGRNWTASAYDRDAPDEPPPHY